MNILALYPGLNLEINEFAYVMQHLADSGHRVTVITAQQNPMKGIQASPPYEESGQLRIYRPYQTYNQMVYFPRSRLQQVQTIVENAAPDVLFCSQEYNMLLAKMIQRRVPMPMVLAVEFAGRLAEGKIPGRIRTKLMWLVGVPTVGRYYWRWLCQAANGIITFDPTDRARLHELSSCGPQVHYVPWCNPQPTAISKPLERKKQVVYIGSFSRYKNTDALGWAIPQILDQTPTECALLIGPGETKVVETLQEQYGARIEYRPACSRPEALTAIAASFFAFTPSKAGFGGFIGDAWSMETPVVTVPGIEGLTHNQEVLIPATEDQLAATVNRLYEEPALYCALQAGGAARAEQSSVPSVAAQILAVLSQVCHQQA